MDWLGLDWIGLDAVARLGRFLGTLFVGGGVSGGHTRGSTWATDLLWRCGVAF
jgi:hypothetical protein